MRSSGEISHRARTSDDRIHEFLQFLTSRELKGVRFEKDHHGGVVRFVDCTFFPFDDVRNFFEDREKINQLLRSIYGAETSPIAAETIYSSCLKVFCILLLINRGDLIRYCVGNNVNDLRLPFHDFPRDLKHLKDMDENFWPAFEQQQWRFCPHKFEIHHINFGLSSATIFPIHTLETIDAGEGRVITKIVLHGGYHSLRSRTPGVSDECERDRNTFVLKSLDGADGRNIERYESEVYAFQRLGCNGLPHVYKDPPNEIIRCFGSFKNVESYHILLEYADIGSLQDYLMETPKPSNQQEFIDFWESMKAIAIGVTKIHNVLDTQNNESIGAFKGYHQDLNLSNILVFSIDPQSKYKITLKIADLGLTKFVPDQYYWPSVSGEGRAGTRTFGSPEAHQARDSSNGYFKSGQPDDVWSLACIFSTAATWTIDGWRHVVQYGKFRKMARKKAEKVGNDTFHDDEMVLGAIEEWHEGLTDEAPNYDRITCRLWEDLLASAFAPADTRAPAMKFRFAATSLPKTTNEVEQRSSMASIPYAASQNRSHFGQRPVDMVHTSDDLETFSRGRRERDFSTSLAESSQVQNHGFSSIQCQGYNDTSDRLWSASVHAASNVIGDGHIHESPIQSPINDTGLSRTQFVDLQSLNDQKTRQQAFQQGELSILDDYVEPSTKLPDTSKSPNKNSNRGSASLLTHDVSASRNGRGEVAGAISIHDSSCALHPSNQREIERMSVDQLFAWKEARDRYDVWRGGKDTIDKMIPYSNLKNNLKDRDHVFLFDNSRTMEQYWEYLIKLFGAIAKFIKECDKDGMEIYTMNGNNYLKKTDSRPLIDKVMSVGLNLNSSTQPEPALRKIWEDHEAAIQSGKKKNVLRRGRERVGLTIYIFTDGDWRGSDSDMERLISEIVVFLVRNNCHEHQVGIQFIQFGTGDKETRRLDAFDRELKGKGRTSRDIVDREPATGNVWKMLLGSVLSNFDDDDLDKCTCQSIDNRQHL